MGQKLSDILGNSSSTVNPSGDDKTLKSNTEVKLQVVTLPSSHTPFISGKDKVKLPPDRNPHDLIGDYQWSPNMIADELKRVIQDPQKYFENKAVNFLWKLAGNTLADIVPYDANVGAVMNFVNNATKGTNNKWLQKLTSSWHRASLEREADLYLKYQGNMVAGLKTEPVPKDPRLSNPDAYKWSLSDTLAAINTSSKLQEEVINKNNRETRWINLAKKQLGNDVIETFVREEITKEADKLNLPCQIPDSKIIYFGGNVQDAVGKILAKDVVYGDVKSGSTGKVEINKSDSKVKGGITADGVEDFWEKYGVRSDPYGEMEDLTNAPLSLNDVINNIRKNGLESDYHIFNGFEMGSNHDWMIRLSPYKSCHGEPCTPPLPCYVLPRYTKMVHDSELESKGWYHSSVNSISDKVYARIAERLGANASEVKSQDALHSVFSFGYDCPCLTYNFNIGTIKTDQMKLWNGDTTDLFNGMNYHMTLNMSILDDMFGSLSKYWMSYINACYDNVHGAQAPYWASLFVIDLIIFRTGKQINWRYKLIGSPIEWSPSFSGDQSPNETRVDVTFSIVGLIQPSNLADPAKNGFQERKFNVDGLKVGDDNWYPNKVNSALSKFNLRKLEKWRFGIQTNMDPNIRG